VDELFVTKDTSSQVSFFFTDILFLFQDPFTLNYQVFSNVFGDLENLKEYYSNIWVTLQLDLYKIGLMGHWEEDHRGKGPFSYQCDL
jgi:hypothetical protein